MINNYPIHIDIFALFIFLGTVQGIFLSYFFLTKKNRQIKSNLFLGLLLVACSLLSFDILISYTNFMFQVIYLVDATEPLNLVIGPLFFLYILAMINESKIKKIYYHFAPALVYFLYTIFFHLRSLEAKYNAYLEQYHPNLNFVPVPGGSFSDPLLIKRFINELTILSITIYLILSAIYLYKEQSASRKNENRIFKKLWIDVAIMTSILLTIIFVKVYYSHDFGDYIIIVAICLFIYATSFKVIRSSIFFKNSVSGEKYSKSALDEKMKEKILFNINEIMQEKYYLNNSPSLPDFAKKVGSSPNYVSQVINEKLNFTFLELINKYRVEEAKNMILDPELNETIEGIAYNVGFNSKSTFHSAFKRITGQTPLEYKNSPK